MLINSTDRVFVESSGFRRQVDRFGFDLLKDIQLAILKDPGCGELIEGTGGLRKFRIARAGRGKSGGFRVFYLDLPQKGICHLPWILAKNEAENIDQSEKNRIRDLVE